ncbi:MAG: matrix protein [Fuyun tick rhabdovirus]|uniref:Matrix protein n=1 Tax=Fuyun tick rhabdovirus TaxID=2977134 RepID=A0A977R7T2_9RHAB|nr:MAG: matrix protein [Fuyun tick rhabdovirus]
MTLTCQGVWLVFCLLAASAFPLTHIRHIGRKYVTEGSATARYSYRESRSHSVYPLHLNPRRPLKKGQTLPSVTFPADAGFRPNIPSLKLLSSMAPPPVSRKHNKRDFAQTPTTIKYQSHAELSVPAQISALFDRVDIRQTPLIKCGGSSPGRILPIPPRPTCVKPVNQRKFHYYPTAVHLLKQDLTSWSIQAVECRTKRIFRRCTVYFFGAQEKAQWEEDVALSISDCPSHLSPQSALSFRTSEKSSQILIQGAEPDYPCSWTGTSVTSADIHYRITTTALINHHDMTIHSPVSTTSMCTASQESCPTASKGWLVWDFKGYPHSDRCPLQLSQHLACSTRLSTTANHLIIQCNKAHLMFHLLITVGNTLSPPTPVYNCSSIPDIASSVYTTEEGYLISLSINRQSLPAWLTTIQLNFPPGLSAWSSHKLCSAPGADPHSCQGQSTRRSASQSPPTHDQSSYGVSQLTSGLSRSELEWSLEMMASMDQGMISEINDVFCHLFQAKWDHFVSLAKSDQKTAVSLIMGSPQWTGIMMKGFVHAWRCSNITKYRFKANPLHHPRWPIEYSDGITIHQGFLESPSMEIHESPGVLSSKFKGAPFLYPYNRTHAIGLYNNTGKLFARSPLFQPLSAQEQDIIFSSVPLYSISELTDHKDLWDSIDQLKKYTQALSTSVVPSWDSSDTTLNGEHTSHTTPKIHPSWTNPFCQLFGSVLGPIIQTLTEVIAFLVAFYLIIYCVVSWVRRCVSPSQSSRRPQYPPHDEL